MSDEFQASVARVEAAILRTAEAQDELDLAKEEQVKIVSDYFVECGGRREDHVEPCPSGDTLFVKSEAEELVVKAGDGCYIVFLNTIGIVRVEAGDGSIITFEGGVAGANINQGAGGDVSLEKTPLSVSINQGAGSTVTVEEDADEV